MLKLNSVHHIAIICSDPEALGLRHLAFEVDRIDAVCEFLTGQGVPFEAVRTDTLTGKQFTFITDPDKLPIEFYEK
jgi:glyoxylase I family protein